MGSSLESVEQKTDLPSAAVPERPFDPISLMAETLTAEKTHQVLGVSAAGGLSAAAGKLGLDYYASSRGWMQVTEKTFQSTVSSAAPDWAKSYLNHLSPSVKVAQEAAGTVRLMSPQLAAEARDYAAGAKFFTAPGTVVDNAKATADYMTRLRDPRLAINANAPVTEVLAYTKQNVGNIAGAAEREYIVARMAALEGEMLVVQRPLLQAAKASAISGVLQGAAVGGMSYVVDGQLSSAAKAYYGENSELGRVLEPTLTGAFLTGAGCVLGSNLRTKVAFSAAGWLTGKAINYFNKEG